MISIMLKGGLCNAMFQIATIEYLGKKFNMDVCYTNVDTWLGEIMQYSNTYSHAEDYLKIFPNMDLYKNHNKRFIAKRKYEVLFRYNDCLPEDGDLFVGYFQSEKNFPDRKFIENLFTPSNFIKKEILKYDSLFHGVTCSIHVRRGDYLNWEEVHPVLDIDYFTRAMLFLESFNMNITKFLIFSDDIAWCKNNFIGDKFVFMNNIDYIDLFLMAKCSHHIISNSSFAWWGAWLQETDQKITIAPEKWFGSSMPIDHGADIIPRNRWAKM